MPGNTEPNPKQVNVVSTHSGLQLEEIASKKIGVKAIIKESKQKKVNSKEKGVVAPFENVKPIARPPSPFPQKFKKQKEDECFGKFLSLLKLVHINFPMVYMLHGIPRYTNYVKEIVANKRSLIKYETIALTEKCSSRI